MLLKACIQKLRKNEQINKDSKKNYKNANVILMIGRFRTKIKTSKFKS